MLKRSFITLLTALCGLIILTGTVYAIPLPPTGTITAEDVILAGTDYGDEVGGGGTIRLPSGNIIVLSPYWNDGRGAVTCLTPAQLTPLPLPFPPRQVTAENSLVGSQPNDHVGEHVIVLADGSYVVGSPQWDNGSIVDAGAVTWVDGNTCQPYNTETNGATINPMNSLVGSGTNDRVGTTITALSNTNLNTYMVISPSWGGGIAESFGAVTIVSSPERRAGIVSASNSLVGSTNSDQSGMQYIQLKTGQVFLKFKQWDNPITAKVDVGAVVRVILNTPTVGAISASNALIGTNNSDNVGNGTIALVGGSNYIITTPLWDNGATPDVGAITWVNGNIGLVGEITPANSLIGSSANDKIGNGDFLSLPNGNYVVSSRGWDNEGVTDAGAVYMGDGSKKVTGTLSAANALVGEFAEDRLGQLIPIEGSSFFVHALDWNTRSGALRRFDGSSPVRGTISAANALIGATPHDWLGYGGVTRLTSGHFVVGTPYFDKDGMVDVGAVTWVNKNGATVGTIKASNSLTGTAANNLVGNRIRALSNGHYVVSSQYWDNAGVQDVGAVTWMNGTTPTSGVVSTANSLVGSTADDQVGRIITILTNSNIIVSSGFWDNGSATNAGAATWMRGTGPTSAVVSPANSLVGSKTNDSVGMYTMAVLANGHALMASPLWDNDTLADVGVVTWMSSTEPTIGVVSSANSMIGRTAGDSVGNRQIFILANGNYVIPTNSWDSDTLADVGSVTWCDGSEPCAGVVSTANSLVGVESGYLPLTRFIAYPNGDYLVHMFTDLNISVATTTVIYGDGTRPLIGEVGTEIGLQGVINTTVLPDYSIIISDPNWQNSIGDKVGMVARIDAPVNRLQNPSYETAGSPAKFAANWKLNAGATTGDKRVCHTPAKPITRTEGNCVFQFSSSNTPAKARTLKQPFNLPNWANVGDTLTLTADVEGVKVGTGAKKIILNVKYDNNTIDKATLTIPAGTYGYTTLVGTVKLTRPVKNITVIVNVGKAKGRIRIDNMTLRDSASPLRFPLLGENTTRDGASPFALPAAPEGFRH